MQLIIAILSSIIFTLSASAAEKSEAKLTWLGHAAFQYTSKNGTVFLIDPWLKNPKAPKGYKLPKKIDAILLTHGHFDHVGEAFALAKKLNVPVVASFELTEIAKRKGVKSVMPLNPQGTHSIGGVNVTAVNAVHSSGYQEGKRLVYAGAPVGYVLSEEGSPTVYHAGDTGVFGDMRDIHELYRPSVVLLPIGGIYTMKPAEAALAAKYLDAKAVVPMHFGTFPALSGTPAQLKQAMDDVSASGEVRELKPGAEVTLKNLTK